MLGSDLRVVADGLEWWSAVQGSKQAVSQSLVLPMLDTIERTSEAFVLGFSTRGRVGRDNDVLARLTGPARSRTTRSRDG